MKIRPFSMFKYNFRLPGGQVEGPIRYAIGETNLGTVLIGASRLGICSIFLGEDGPSLLEQLRRGFPGTQLVADEESLLPELSEVIAFIDNGASEGVIQLDIGGTAFEQKVWRELCEIPSGQTLSYAAVARKLGVPESVRAVAGACAANVLAIAIPCHRVLRSDGSISGYRWGVERKRALLAEESTPGPTV